MGEWVEGEVREMKWYSQKRQKCKFIASFVRDCRMTEIFRQKPS